MSSRAPADQKESGLFINFIMAPDALANLGRARKSRKGSGASPIPINLAITHSLSRSVRDLGFAMASGRMVAPLVT